MGDFHNLRVWNKAHQLTLNVYRVTAAFPGHEMFGLTNQMRRASVSIPANIAEGSGRGGDREFVRFLRIAMGSAAELEYQLLLARDLSYLPDTDYFEVATSAGEVKKMLHGLLERFALDRDDPRRATRDS